MKHADAVMNQDLLDKIDSFKGDPFINYKIENLIQKSELPK